MAALVLESSPPMITRAVMSSCLRISRPLSNCSFLSEFGASGTDDVEAAGVAVFVDNVGCQLHILVETAGAHEEAEETAVAVYFLDAVEQTADHVVAAGGLTAGKDHAHVEGVCPLWGWFFQK